MSGGAAGPVGRVAGPWAPAVLALTCAGGAAGLTACDLDFVEVSSTPRALVRIESNHSDRLYVTARVTHSQADGPVTVTVDGTFAAAIEEGDGRWIHEVTVVADSLDPVVRVGMEAGRQGQLVDVPIVARAGPAYWSDFGDLHLPVVREPLPAPSIGRWSVDLLDAGGQLLISVLSSRTALPIPFVISGSVVPDEAVRAELRHRMGAELEADRAYPITLSVESKTAWDVP